MTLSICILETDNIRPELVEQYRGYGWMFQQLFARQPIAADRPRPPAGSAAARPLKDAPRKSGIARVARARRPNSCAPDEKTEGREKRHDCSPH